MLNVYILHGGFCRAFYCLSVSIGLLKYPLIISNDPNRLIVICQFNAEPKQPVGISLVCRLLSTFRVHYARASTQFYANVKFILNNSTLRVDCISSF